MTVTNEKKFVGVDSRYGQRIGLRQQRAGSAGGLFSLKFFEKNRSAASADFSPSSLIGMINLIGAAYGIAKSKRSGGVMIIGNVVDRLFAM